MYLNWILDCYLGEEGSSGESSFGGGEEDPKSRFGKTPGGLSRGLMESNCEESPTTSAHP